jgi:uncharacterized membrane protein
MQFNQHVKHPAQYLLPRSVGDRVARHIEPLFGSMRMFFILVLAELIWIALATIGVGFFKHDKYPFVFLLFLSNLYQLWALPVLGYLTKQADKKREAKATADHEALTHIANQLDAIAQAQGITLTDGISE